MAKGFVDSASIHSALAVLKLGGTLSLSTWERQCLLETTYLFLFTDIGIIAGPSNYRGASGLLSHVVKEFPSLEEKRFSGHDAALRSTRQWLRRDERGVKDAWAQLQSQSEFEAWSTVWRELFWVDHVRMHGGLFNYEFLSNLASVLGCSPQELNDVRTASQNEKTLRKWLNNKNASADAKIANDAYLLAALIRGRYHEYLASHNGVHLCGHPFRRFIGRSLQTTLAEPVLTSEEFFVRALVGSALIETTADRRVKTWIENITKARKALLAARIVLPPALTQEDSETLAAEAAKKCSFSTSYARIRREIDFATSVGLGGLVAVAISPWLGPFAGMLPHVYRYYRGQSVGDDLSRLALDTSRRFRRLARAQPGRIERSLRLISPTRA